MEEKLFAQVNKICMMLEDSEIKRQMESLKTEIDEDEEINKLITEFEEAKQKYYQVTEYGTHHPDFKRVSHQLIDAKTKLFENEQVSKYKQLENQMSRLTLEINEKIKSLIPSKKTCHTK